MYIKDYISKYFTRQGIIRHALICFTYFLVGILLFSIIYLLSDLAKGIKQIQFVIQNIAFIFLFISILLAYGAVHWSNIQSGRPSLRTALVQTLKRSHLIAAVIVSLLAVVTVVALVEVGISMIGFIPYAGPAIVAILALPFLLINFTIICAVVVFLTIGPPQVMEGGGFMTILRKVKELAARRWLVILLSTLASLIVIALLLSMVLILIRYAAGITKAAQWNVNVAYPRVFNFILKDSYITDILNTIAPKANPIEAVMKYSPRIKTYLNILGAEIWIAYGLGLTAIVSFTFSLYFNALSCFFIGVKKSVS